MRIGFIGLGNVGGQLAGNLLRHGAELTVRDLDAARVADFVARGAKAAASPRELAGAVDLVITCLPSPVICAQVMESTDGVLSGLSAGKIWLEMSTTDQAEAKHLGAAGESVGRLCAGFTPCPAAAIVRRPATYRFLRAASVPPLSASCRCSPYWGSESCIPARWDPPRHSRF